MEFILQDERQAVEFVAWCRQGGVLALYLDVTASGHFAYKDTWHSNRTVAFKNAFTAISRLSST